MSRRIATIKTDNSKAKLDMLANNISALFGVTGNMPEGYNIEEIQIDVLHGETRIIINNE